MGVFSVMLIGIGLAMDAFAASCTKGLAMKKTSCRNALTVGLYFGIAQALMPIIGYFCGMQFCDIIKNFDHWIAFALLAAIGVNMLKEAFSKDREAADASVSFGTLSVLAVATSIDALATGISFACGSLRISIITASLIIGLTTFLLCVLGVWIGNLFGNKYKSKAETAGGLILILMGVKILFDHLSAG